MASLSRIELEHAVRKLEQAEQYLLLAARMLRGDQTALGEFQEVIAENKRADAVAERRHLKAVDDA